MIHDLHGKRALVTGASRGLGVYIAKALAKNGADLVLSARNQSSLAGVAAECEALGVKAQAVACDVSRVEDRARLLDEAGDIDVLVNNAGVEIAIAFSEQTTDDVTQQLETNLAAPLDLTHRALPQMLTRGSGVVVNISSMSGKSPTPYNSVYAATKYALNGFTASLAIELEGSGVHVGVVCPGFVAAGMWADSGAKAPAMMREVPPERVADAVLKVIRGAKEVLVTPTPARPMLAIGELFPSFPRWMLATLGVTRALKERAVKHPRHLEGGAK